MTDTTAAPSGLTRAARLLTLPLAAFGLFVGGLLTWHHDTQLYGTAAQQGELIGCTESTTVNCDIVNTSAYAEFLGVPIASLAIAYYVMVALLVLQDLRGRSGARSLLLVGATLSLVYSGFLFFISKTELGYVCAWCIRLYATNAAIFALSLAGGKPSRPDGAQVGTWTAVLVGLLLAVAGGERLYRGTLGGPGLNVAAEADVRDGDPKGDAPVLSIDVVTEDGKQTKLVTEPNDAWTGARDARVSVVMFGDLECGYCKRSSAELARLEATYGDRVLFVFKHFPMDPTCNPGVKNKKHRDACGAAKASVCAKEQGQFWKFHDLAYKNQHQLGAESLREYAEQAGVDVALWDACMKGPAADQEVFADAQAGAALDIHGTPRIFIQGKLYRAGTSAEAMAQAIEVALGADPAAAAQAASSLRESLAIAPIPADVPADRQVSFGASSFRIDTFEAAVVDGKAVSAKHQVPALRTSWFDAKAACEAAGKRMCTEAEWVSVCQGAAAIDDNHNGELADDMIEGTAYPYGDLHDPRRCWDAKEGDTFRPVYTGELPGCATPTGVYDLTGNVEEWVGESPDKAVLLGGAFDTPDEKARCYRRNDTFGPGFAAPRTGFRCCAN